MSQITQAIYDRMAEDTGVGGLTSMLATYEEEPAIFTVDPVPKNADLPYIVSAGDVAASPWDTKDKQGREVWRDVRCYASANDSAMAIEAIAERVRWLFHRRPLVVAGQECIVAECSGPVSADESDAYGRIITVRLMMIAE